MMITHDLDPADAAAVAKIRELAAPNRGKMTGPDERKAFEQMMLHVCPAADGVRYEAGTEGGVSGLWCLPQGASRDRAILYLHGGGFTVGSSKSHTHFAGQIAARARVPAFIPDYRLAPEHRFPAAIDDADAVYAALAKKGPVVVVGDSAGGNLAVGLRDARVVVALSPFLDLAMTGPRRVHDDPYFTYDGTQATVARYLGGADPKDPRASPLYRTPLRAKVLIHAGTAEIFVDDALRMADRAEVHIWTGMPHVFPANLGTLRAAEPAMANITAFISAHLPSV